MFNFINKNFLNKVKSDFETTESELLNKIVEDVKTNFKETSEKCELEYNIKNEYDEEFLKQRVLTLIDEKNTGDFLVIVRKESEDMKITIDWSFALYGLKVKDVGQVYEKTVIKVLDDVKNCASVGNIEFEKVYTPESFLVGYDDDDIRNMDIEEIEFVISKVKECVERTDLLLDIFFNENEDIIVNVKW